MEEGSIGPKEGVEQGKLKKRNRKRKRPRSAALRKKIVERIEIALRAHPCPIGHLFDTVDSDGTPHARLSLVLTALEFPEATLSQLSPVALQSLNRVTSLFYIALEDEWMIKHRPSEEDNPRECMVYLDRLPDAVTRERLGRELCKYGTVVDIRIPQRARTAMNGLQRTRRPCGFAFVQFTEREAVRRLCSAYSRNLPRGLRRWHLSRIIIIKERRIRRRESLQLQQEKARKALELSNISEPSSLAADTYRLSTSSAVVASTEPGSELPSPVKDGIRPRLLSTSSFASEAAEQKGKNVSFAEGQPGEQAKKKRKRKRKKHKINGLVPDPAYIHGTVCKHFRRMQVLPFTRYRELRREYVALQRKKRLDTPKNLCDPNEAVKHRDSLWTIEDAVDSDVEMHSE